MNIILLGTAYPLRGGIAHYVGLLWKYLSRHHQVTVVTFSRQYPSLLFPGKTQQETGDAGIPLESLPWMDSINPFSWIRTGWRLRARKPDLLLFKYWMPFFAPCYGVISAIVRWRRPTKVVYICDNLIPHEHRPGDRLLTRFALRFVDGYVVQSRSVEQDLRTLVTSPRYRYLPHPVYEIFGDEISRTEARSQLAARGVHLEPSDKVVLFFGYVREYKGLDVLLDAVPLVLGRHRVRVLVVGEFYNNEQAYRDQVSRLGLEQIVHFHADYVPNEEVGMFFSAADVLALPYKSATQSGIIQIAYNFRRPVIATDVGGLGEVVRDGVTGYIRPPDDPAALAEAMVRFFDEDRFTEFRENVILEARKYSWDAMVEGIEDLATEWFPPHSRQNEKEIS